MYLFSFLLFPVVFSFYIYRDFNDRGGFVFLKNKILPSLFGLCCAVFLCLLFEYFVFLPQYHGTSKFAFFALNWLVSFFLPALFYGLYILWSKDEWAQRIDNFLYFMLSFYMIYLPFLCFSAKGGSAFFILFFAPLLFLFMLFPIKREVFTIFEKSVPDPKMIVKNAVFIFFESAVPSFIYMLWHFDFFVLTWTILSFLYIGFCVVYGRLEFMSVILAFIKDEEEDKK